MVVRVASQVCRGDGSVVGECFLGGIKVTADVVMICFDVVHPHIGVIRRVDFRIAESFGQVWAGRPIGHTSMYMDICAWLCLLEHVVAPGQRDFQRSCCNSPLSKRDGFLVDTVVVAAGVELVISRHPCGLFHRADGRAH